MCTGTLWYVPDIISDIIADYLNLNSQRRNLILFKNEDEYPPPADKLDIKLNWKSFTLKLWQKVVKLYKIQIMLKLSDGAHMMRLFP